MNQKCVIYETLFVRTRRERCATSPYYMDKMKRKSGKGGKNSEI